MTPEEEAALRRRASPAAHDTPEAVERDALWLGLLQRVSKRAGWRVRRDLRIVDECDAGDSPHEVGARRSLTGARVRQICAEYYALGYGKWRG